MISFQNNYTFSGKNEYFDFVIHSYLGDREEQQDTSGYFISDNCGAVALCDGMGGHRGGKLAGKIGAETLISACEKSENEQSIRKRYIDAATEADRKISALCDESGSRLMAGTTAVSVFLYKRLLQWISVGDSRIYLARNSDFIQVTTDHNLKTLLNFQLQAGEIEKQEYDSKIADGNMLVSFFGMGGLMFIDTNDSMLPLEKNDTVFLTTDGLYKLLNDELIKEILMNFKNSRDAADALIYKAKRQSEKTDVSMDNTTFAIIKIK